MEKTNFMQVVPNSQFYTDLEMIKRNVENLKFKLHFPDKKDKVAYPSGEYTGLYYGATSLEEDINYLIIGLENTIKRVGAYPFQLKPDL